MIYCSPNFTYVIGIIKANVEVYCTLFDKDPYLSFFNEINTTQRSTTSIPSSQCPAKSYHFIFSFSTGAN